MVAGFWYNQDGLPLQYGTQKAIPELGGDYLVYGETREIEQLIPLVPMVIAGNTVPAPPTTFTGNTTVIAAGIQSLTNLVPLQVNAVNAGGSTITLTTPQLFFEEVTVEGLITATGGTSIAVGLVTTSPGTPNSTFVQVTPNAGSQLIGTLATANMVAGQRVSFTQAATTGLRWDTATAVGTSGNWMGNVPLVTNALTPLPQSAWISTIATGTFTNGLIKLRLRYTMYGDINF